MHIENEILAPGAIDDLRLMSWGACLALKAFAGVCSVNVKE